MKLAGAEVKVRDRVALAGYGTNDSNKPGLRQAGESLVSRIQALEGGSIQFVGGAQPLQDGGFASQLEQGDSGGACFSSMTPPSLGSTPPRPSTPGAREAPSSPACTHLGTGWNHRSRLPRRPQYPLIARTNSGPAITAGTKRSGFRLDARRRGAPRGRTPLRPCRRRAPPPASRRLTIRHLRPPRQAGACGAVRRRGRGERAREAEAEERGA